MLISNFSFKEGCLFEEGARSKGALLEKNAISRYEQKILISIFASFLSASAKNIFFQRRLLYRTVRNILLFLKS